MRYKQLFSLFFLLLLITPVNAHDIWLVKASNDQYRLVFGHPGDLEPYDPGKVTSVLAIDKQGQHHTPRTHVHEMHLIVDLPSGSSLITISYDAGIKTEAPDGTVVNKPKGDVPGYVSSEQSMMFAKTLFNWNELASKPVGSRLEIVPLANPFDLEPGNEFPVRVLYDSKPLAGAELEILGVMDLFLTDKDGKVTVILPEGEFQYLLAYHKIALKDHSDTDEIFLSANLTFNY